MLARHAENMFWAGRYVERAENTARMLRATLQSATWAGPGQATKRLQMLLLVLRLEQPISPNGDVTEPPSEAGTCTPELSTPGAVLDRLVAEPDSPGSIGSSIASTRENLRSLREQIPAELWEHNNRLHLRIQEPAFRETLQTDPFEALDLVREGCQTLSGVISTSMPRDEGYRFLILGQTIERALMTCRLVEVRYPVMSISSYDETALTLRSASALEAYQRAFNASPDPRDVVRFLLLSNSFPRALLFCLRKTEEQLLSLGPDAATRPRQHVGHVRSRLEYTDAEHILDDPAIALVEIEEQVRDVANAIRDHYFRNAQEFDLQSQLLLPGAEQAPPDVRPLPRPGARRTVPAGRSHVGRTGSGS